MALDVRTGGLAGIAQTHARPQRRVNLKFVGAGLVLLGVLAFLGYNALQSATVYYYFPSEIVQKSAAFAPDQQLRMTGKVVPNSASTDPFTRALSFKTLDTNDNATTMTVVYSGVVPDTFWRENASVVVTGTYKNGTFAAKELLAKCPSKYESSSDGTAAPSR